MMKQFLTYAEYYEDWILYRALDGVTNGFYVDVGANSSWWFSVTKAFYDIGWHGINIEPLENEYNLLCRDRPRDINLNIGAGSQNGSLELFMLGGCSTFNTDIVEHAEKVQKKTVPVKRLGDILPEHINDKNQDIHFLKIDVEEFERSVLEGMDFTRFRPWIMMLEENYPAYHKQWEDILLDNGYEHAYTFGSNRFYVDARNKSCEGVKNNFKNMDNFWKEYKFFRIRRADKHIISTVICSTFKYCLNALLSVVCPIKLFKNKALKYKQSVKDARALMRSV